MSRVLQSQIVGVHFRPPAKSMLEALPSGHPLLLVPEPTNAYDAEAIQVLVSIRSILDDPRIDQEWLRDACGTQGADWEELCAIGEPIHLGYVISSTNKKLGAWAPNTVVGDTIKGSEWSASLGFSPEGQALVLTKIEEGQEP